MNGNSSFTNCLFNSNTGESGGAVHIEGGNSSFENCSFTSNNVMKGGVVEVSGSIGSFINCSFTANNANDGGAVLIKNGNYSFDKCLFIYNNGSLSGGSIFIYNFVLPATLNVTNSQFKDNFANIVYINDTDNIYIDNATRDLSDSDLLCKFTQVSIILNNYTYGSNGTIVGNVTCMDETLVSGLVYVVIANKTYTGIITEGKGIIVLTGLDAGNYTFSIIYNGTEELAKASSSSIKLTVYKQSIKINPPKINIIKNYGGTYTATINTKCAGLALSLYLSNKKIGSATTSASGKAKITIKPSMIKNIKTGTHKVVVKFAGDKNHNSAQVTGKITLNKEKTKLLNVKSVKKYYRSTARSMQLTATLKNSKYKFIKNQWVYFKVNKKIYKVKTNSKGVAKLTFNIDQIKACKINKKGTYKFTVTYKTTDNYKPATKNGKLKVLK
ncbi:hypothetical protein [uncultured Methanobrevibacter sp.]|uniref:hypothetical protein n=1 Tax=uncultured Methanobrevibacter sp. TaxID=253161 RepID=UPI0025E4553B|nr:hypothetical protein [uncultured Methanobrevibacter sp.]